MEGSIAGPERSVGTRISSSGESSITSSSDLVVSHDVSRLAVNHEAAIKEAASPRTLARALQPKIGVVVKDLTVWVHRREKQALVKNMNLAANPGELMCIMGPSGGGKTTLLNAIAARLPNRKMEGTIWFNGERSTQAVCKKFVSYVMAKDYLLPYLTVKETLTLNSRVRQPNMAQEERKALVQEVAEALELVEVLPCYVGGAWKKGLSTGQMKRLSIAIELLSNPSVFLLDEPSSGLDSKLALQLIRILKKVAVRGKTVIVTLHQPSHMAFSIFDHLCLISRGQLVYHGPADHSLNYFATLNHICPPNFNPADFVVEVITDKYTAGVARDMAIEDSSSSSSSNSKPKGRVGRYLHRGQSQASSTSKSKTDPDIDNGVFGPEADGSDAAAQRRRMVLGDRAGNEGPFYSSLEEIQAMCEVFNSTDEHAELVRRQEEILSADPEDCKRMHQLKFDQGQAGWREQFRMVWRRTALNSVRNPMVTGVIVLINIIHALVLGAIFWQLTSDMPSITSAPLSDLIVWTDQFTYWLAYGLDFNGLMPIGNSIDYGTDGKNRSVVFDLLTSPNIMDWVNQVITCTHTEAGLDEIYPRNNWLPDGDTARMLLGDGKSPGWISPAASLWARHTLKATGKPQPLDGEAWETSPSDGRGAAERHLSASEPWPIVSMSSAQLNTDLVSLLQIADHYLLKTEYPAINGKTPLAYWMQVFTRLAPYVDPLLYCISLDTWSPSFSTRGPKPNTPGALERHDGNYVPYPGASSGGSSGLAEAPGHSGNLMTSEQMEHRVTESLQVLQTAATNLRRVWNNVDDVQGRHHIKKAPKRKLGSGLSGLIQALLDLIISSPDSPLYPIYEASNYIVGILSDCDNTVCQSINSGLDAFGTFMTDTMTTMMTVINIAGLAFFISATIGFASYDVLLHFPAERPLFNRDNANGLYSSSAYYLAKVSCDILFQLVPNIFWSAVIYWMVGFPTSASQFFIYMGIAMALSFAAYGFGYTISSIAPRVEFGVILAPLVLVIMLCLAGFFLRDPMIAGWISWFRFFSIYRWSFFAILINLFPPGTNYGTMPCELLLLISGVMDDRLWFCILMLIVLGVGFRVLGYLGLVFTNRRVGLES